MSREPRWLDAAEREAWLAFVGVLVRMPSALDAGTRRATGLSMFEYVTMAMLSEVPERRLRMSELAAMNRYSLSRLSHVVSRLEERGWLERTPDAEDGRVINVRLTDDGWAQVQACAPSHVEVVRQLVIDALSPEQRAQLADIGTTLLDRLDAELGPSPRPTRRPAA
jgi:DNA-binding MarR family transcriptional regulator